MKLIASVLLLLAMFAGLLVYINRANEVATYEFCAQFSSGNSVVTVKRQAAAQGYEIISEDSSRSVDLAQPTQWPLTSQYVCQVAVSNNKVQALTVVKQ